MGLQVQFEIAHNLVHGLVGGKAQYGLSSLSYSAFDPIFYLHHSNIDRIWAIWTAVQQHRLVEEIHKFDALKLSPLGNLYPRWHLFVSLLVDINKYKLCNKFPTVEKLICFLILEPKSINIQLSYVINFQQLKKLTAFSTLEYRGKPYKAHCAQSYEQTPLKPFAFHTPYNNNEKTYSHSKPVSIYEYEKELKYAYDDLEFGGMTIPELDNYINANLKARSRTFVGIHLHGIKKSGNKLQWCSTI